jgi:hypothetical protein
MWYLFRSSALHPSSGLQSMGSVRTAKAERRMKEKLQQEVGVAVCVCTTGSASYLLRDFNIIINHMIENTANQFLMQVC